VGSEAKILSRKLCFVYHVLQISLALTNALAFNVTVERVE